MRRHAAHPNVIPRQSSSFTRRVLVAVGSATAVVLALLLLWHATDVLLLIFAGLLLAVFLRTSSNWLSKHTPLTEGWALAVLLAALASATGSLAWFSAGRAAAQIDLLVEQLPRAVRELQHYIEGYPLGRRLRAQLPTATAWTPPRENVFARVTGIFSSTLGLIMDVAVIFFVGLYLAVDPRLYLRGVLRLVPLGRRRRASEVMRAAGETLWWLLLGRLFSMAVIGVLTALGLWLLGVPLALTLGLVAALLTFVPLIGPILAAVPAVLLALLQSPRQALLVVALYLAIQAVETYLITPLVLRRTAALPPALTLAVLTLAGVFFGFLGLLLAAPIGAVVLILVKMIYVEDLLGDRGGQECDHEPV